jgi:hypothetical protein
LECKRDFDRAVGSLVKGAFIFMKSANESIAFGDVIGSARLRQPVSLLFKEFQSFLFLALGAASQHLCYVTHN